MPKARTSQRRRNLSLELRKAGRKAEIWTTLSETVRGPRSHFPVVDLDRLNRLTTSGETVAVPGKVLGGGKVDHPLTVAAMHFSLSSARAIQSAGGKVLSLNELAKRKPDGKGVRIIA